MSIDTVSIWLLLAWPLLLIVLMRLDRRHGSLPLFVAYSYIATLAISHFFGALVHVSPSNASLASVYTPDGFALTTWGLAFLVAGAAAFPAARSGPRGLGADGQSRNSRSATNILLWMGGACWIAELTPIASLPSFGAVITGGKQLLIAGICLRCWLAWISGNKRKMLLWVLASMGLPLYTMLFLGFLGYGIGYVTVILIFVGTFYRPRWLVAVGGIAAIYAGLCLYVGYVQDRMFIRAAVWGGQSIEDRLAASAKMLGDVTLFDPSDPKHQEMMDGRLNQNWLVGISMHYVPDFQPYAHGETLYMALIGLVPRAIWPDKPETGGSGTLVSDYTGLHFASGTSVGIGQVMEFYVNFGWLGVAVGSFMIGLGLRYIDVRVGASIREGDWSNAGFWFAIGLSGMQPIGQLVEITTSMAAAAVFGTVALRFSQASARRGSTAAVAGRRGTA